MIEYTFHRKYAAITADGSPWVYIPDQVFEDQEAFDNFDFPIVYQDGMEGRAILRGELYGLHTYGTGDPVVEILD